MKKKILIIVVLLAIIAVVLFAGNGREGGRFAALPVWHAAQPADDRSHSAVGAGVQWHVYRLYLPG